MLVLFRKSKGKYDDLIPNTPGRPPEDLRVHGLEPQALRGRPVHEDVDPEDLHGVERVGDVGQGGEGDQHEGRDAGGELEPHKVLDVVEDALALLDGAQDGGEVVVEEDHVGGLLADVGAGHAHADADVGPLDGDAVVDAVAGHADDVPVGLQGVHDADLVLGAGPVERGGSTGFYTGNGRVFFILLEKYVLYYVLPH